jgi:hypothetical protein
VQVFDASGVLLENRRSIRLRERQIHSDAEENTSVSASRTHWDAARTCMRKGSSRIIDAYSAIGRDLPLKCRDLVPKLLAPLARWFLHSVCNETRRSTGIQLSRCFYAPSVARIRVALHKEINRNTV